MKQYIDFYKQQRSSINANSAPVLNALRDKALEVAENGTLPVLGAEHYEMTDLAEMFAPDYGINVNRVEIPVDTVSAFKCSVPKMSTALYFLFNDAFHPALKSKDMLPEGVIVDSLRHAAIEHPELVEKYYGKTAPIENPQVALNTMLAQDGLFVYVPDGVVVESTIQIVNILNSVQPLMVNRRVLIVVGRGAEAKILTCDHTQNHDADFLNNQVIEIVVDENATLDFYDMEESSKRTHRASMMFAKQKANSNFLVNGITLVNGHSRNDLRISIDGENSETNLLGMAIATGKQNIDNNINIIHNVPHCRSNQLYKYLLEDEARGSFNGKILVKPGADKIEAYQGNKNIVASDKAKMHTKPQLEIYTDDVKCSHGATIGQLDQKAMFYMRTRGVSEKQAKMLLMQAFMSDVIAGMKIESLRERLTSLVEKRLSGSMALCKECGTACKCHKHDNENN